MDKIAMVKQAEVSGAVAALIDTGAIKLASDEHFDALVATVADGLEDEYGLGNVLDKTAEVMEQYYALIEAEEEPEKVAEEEPEKVAEEEPEKVVLDEEMAKIAEDGVDEGLIMAAIGELALAKEAGELSEDEFKKEASRWKDLGAYISNQAGKAKGAAGAAAKAVKGKAADTGKGIADALKGKGIGTAAKATKDSVSKVRRTAGAAKNSAKDKLKGNLKDLGKQVGKTTAAYGAAGAGAYGAKALYDRRKNG